MVIPLHDDNPTTTRPYVTVGLMIACTLVYVLQHLLLTEQYTVKVIYALGVIPALLTHQATAEFATLPPELTVLTSMFVHGGFWHLAGNMLYLWIFGNNIEDAMGHVRFAIFYLLCGIGAALLQVMFNPGSGIPMVGASGAISGVMGAYLILYPRVRVFALLVIGFFVTSIALPAWTMLLYWAALQFVSGLFGLLASDRGGVAFWAHVGGFAAGVVLIKLFARSDYVMAHRSHHWEPQRLVGR